MTQTRDKIINAFHQAGVKLPEERLAEIEQWLSERSDTEVDELLSRDVTIRLEQRLMGKGRRRRAYAGREARASSW